MIVEVAKELFSVVIDIIWLLEEAGTEKIVKNLPKFGVTLQIADMFLLNIMFDLSEIGL